MASFPKMSILETFLRRLAKDVTMLTRMARKDSFWRYNCVSPGNCAENPSYLNEESPVTDPANDSALDRSDWFVRNVVLSEMTLAFLVETSSPPKSLQISRNVGR